MALERPAARRRSRGSITRGGVGVAVLAAALGSIDLAKGAVPLLAAADVVVGESGRSVPIGSWSPFLASSASAVSQEVGVVEHPATGSAITFGLDLAWEGESGGEPAPEPGPASEVSSLGPGIRDSGSDPDGAPEWDVAGWIFALLGLVIATAIMFSSRWRLPSEVGPAAIGSPLAGIGTFLLMLLAGIVGAGVGIAGAAEGGEIETAARSMLGMVVGQGLVIAWATAMTRRLATRGGEAHAERDDEIDRRRSLSFGAAAVIGLLAMLLAYPMLALAGRMGVAYEAAWRGIEVDPIAHGTLRLLLDSGGLFASPWSILIAVLVVTGIPLCEEFAYRGILQRVLARWFVGPGGSLRSWVRWSSIGVASALFSLMHMSALPEASRVSSLAMLFAVSIVLGWSYERTGRLIAPIAGHAAFNAINLGVATASF